MQQGAEAVIYLEDGRVIKDRVKKSYRAAELDDGIRKLRTRSEKKLLEKRGEQLKAWLVAHMVPKSHVRLRAQSGGVPDPEFRKAADAMSRGEMSPEFQSVVQEYQNCMRLLGRPDDANLENIRPDSR